MYLNYINTGKEVFELEASAIRNLCNTIDADFSNSVSHILKARGKVIVCGMGKSGIIGKKIAATLASTGTPSFFMHPGEAYHGDLGMVTTEDVFIAISNSGETSEVVKLLPFLRDNRNFLITITGNSKSSLALAGHCHLDISVTKEACPLQLAPTASTATTLAMGDALAVTLMKARNFKPENFARFHPGGSLGRRLLSRVDDEMIKGELPSVTNDTSTAEVISAISRGGLGMVLVTGLDHIAVVTDGDLRRAIEKYNKNFFNSVASDCMSIDPIKVNSGTRVEDALILMERKKITRLLVTKKNIVIGIFKK